MSSMDVEALEQEATEALRRAGARFAFVHGSRAGTAAPWATPPRPDSDLDVAAWWGREAPAPWDVGGSGGHIDLLVLDNAPLELAGRVAVWGRLLFDDDPPARVAWQAQTMKVYLDECDRRKELSRVFLRERARGR